MELRLIMLAVAIAAFTVVLVCVIYYFKPGRWKRPAIDAEKHKKANPWTSGSEP